MSEPAHIQVLTEIRDQVHGIGASLGPQRRPSTDQAKTAALLVARLRETQLAEGSVIGRVGVTPSGSAELTLSIDGREAPADLSVLLLADGQLVRGTVGPAGVLADVPASARRHIDLLVVRSGGACLAVSGPWSPIVVE